MRKALGRGIDSLITKVKENDTSGDVVQKISIDKIRPNHYQPRRNFPEGSIEELSSSIKEHGLLQPINVWKDSGADYYELIAGERRWRASKLAGKVEIEAIVRKDLSDEQKLGLSLMENIQREDLNSIDTALAYQQLMQTFGASQADVARKVHKSRAAVSNTMRLLDLDEVIRQGIQSGLITEGHARALVSVPDSARRLEFFHRIVAEKLTVRDVEDAARAFHAPRASAPRKARGAARKSPEVLELESALEKRLGTKVDICQGPGPQNGKIVVHYYSLDDLDRVTQILQK
ncbi:MAG TPA: ParB/RepB/Spo0J family partition protein [Elusimicrobiales bacterium]|nr:ParB/RepB/Spo0J family partition protein [Elusimicrobiales bacterium]